jgi:hypothetical protein
MSLADLIRGKTLAPFATATPATFATHKPANGPTVATVATVTVASPPEEPAKTSPTASVTVTEPTDAEREAIEYAERVAAIRSRGDVPASYASTTFCEGCGPVHIFQGAPPHVTACPWCANRVRGLPIPRPPVSCATCALWRPDPGERGALVSCEHAAARYPHEGRGCGYWRPLS